MKFCMYVNQITPHLMPLATEMVKLLGENEVRYIYEREIESRRSELGWATNSDASWVMSRKLMKQEADLLLEKCDVLLCERRELELWRRRSENGLCTYYTSERWFKPLKFGLSGWLRLLSPSFFRMARETIRLFSAYENLTYLCNGYYAASDFIKLMRFMNGNPFALLTQPKIKFESRPFGRIDCNNVPIAQLKMWGYFVAPSASADPVCDIGMDRKRVMWAGRFLKLKRVDTIIKAVKRCPNCFLDLYGMGPDELRIRALASSCNRIAVHPPVPVDGVRKLMREHDIYVFASNALEGWGAVVNEAMEEEMCVYGSWEAGASRTLLDESRLFHSADWRSLSAMLKAPVVKGEIGEWGVGNAARQMYERMR